MVQYITNPTFRGNKKLRSQVSGQAIYADDLDFASEEAYIFDFTLVQQAEQLGPVKTLYLDNSVNPKIAEITVDQTGQYIVCPPFSVGFFPLATQENSKVTITSEGGVTGGEKCYAAFLTYDIPPAVWNGFAPLVDGARVTLIGVDGVTNMSGTNPLIVGGFDGTDTRTFKTDSAGRLEVVGSAAGGTVFGPDNPGIGPTQAPIQIGSIDTGNIVRRLVSTVAGWLRVDVASSVLPTGAATEASLATRSSEATLATRASEATLATRAADATVSAGNTILGNILTALGSLATQATLGTISTAVAAIQTILNRPATGTASAPANSTSSFTVLASNANRKGATIWGEGSACKIFLGNGASATVYTIELSVGGYYEVPFGYTGIITGISTSATGNLRVTELT